MKLYRCPLQCYKHFSFSTRNLTPNTRLVVRKEKIKVYTIFFRTATTIKENHEIILHNLAMVKLCLIFLFHSSVFLVFNDFLVLNSHNKCQNNLSIGTQVKFSLLFNTKKYICYSPVICEQLWKDWATKNAWDQTLRFMCQPLQYFELMSIMTQPIQTL